MPSEPSPASGDEAGSGAGDPHGPNGQGTLSHDGTAVTTQMPAVEEAPKGEGPAEPEPAQPEHAEAEPEPPAAIIPRHLRRGGLVLDDEGEAARIGTNRQRLALFAALGAPFILIGLVFVAWAVDNAFHSGQVQRNVELSGHAIGGATDETLPGVIATLTDEVTARDVVVVIKGEETETTAGALGLGVDEEATVQAARDVGRSGSLLTRPFSWMASFFSPRTVSPEYTVSETQVSSALQNIQNVETEDSATPVEPSIELADGTFVIVPGRPGTDLDVPRAAGDLLAAIEASDDPDATVVLETTTAEVVPAISDEQAQQLADQANDVTGSDLTLVADSTSRSLPSGQLRNWVRPVLTPDEQRLDFDLEAAEGAVLEVFGDLNEEPRNASVSLSNGRPRITDGTNGVTCCGEDVGARVWQTLTAGETELELEVEVVEPEYTTADVEGWGIKEPVGGSLAWRSGQGDVGGPKPGFTTYEVGSGGRAHNIRLMADQVNGAVIPPGGRFSINDHVGSRQCPPYQEGGAIVQGEIVSECGGGTSQFATTMFNAAYFAGMDISGSKAHSRYFSRYPKGREATMGPPGSGLDVVVTNNTDYGVLIQTSWEGDTVTVTFWSTDHIGVQQSNISEERSGDCEVVTTTRTRTYPGGATRSDSYTARYSLEEGQTC